MKRAMPKWRPAPEGLVRVFEAAVGHIPDATLKKMFGYPAAFVGGNMFSGLFQESAIVRLPEDQRSDLMQAGARPFEPMPGRPMREYVVLPGRIVDSPEELRRWLEKARAYAAALPPKARTRKTKSARNTKTSKKKTR
jgi:TfoX/Sxy family transcriptional regulator of competence genes